jgi:enoyl-CoA hydratase/carnithine racemase
MVYIKKGDGYMSESKIAVQKEGHVLLIGFDRADKRNALDVDMYWDIAYAYGRLNSDPDLRCVFCMPKATIFLPDWIWYSGRLFC